MQSEPESNYHENVFHIPRSQKVEQHSQVQFNDLNRMLNGLIYCYLTLIILVNISHSFVLNYVALDIAIYDSNILV